MTFVNSPLAWGALAFSVPLILHLLNRSRFRRVEWGAMHLLESVVKVNHRRFRFEQLLLLLIRCAIPALLAMALARPVLTGAQAPAGSAPLSMVLVLDTSYSMSAAAGDTSHFQQAVDAACEIVEAAGRGSEITVICTGGSPTPLFDQPVFDPDAVVRRLRTLRAEYGTGDLPQTLNLSLATLAGMTHARRELIVISDFQSDDWRDLMDSPAIRKQVAALDVPPELMLMQAGQPVTGNVCVESLDYSLRPLGPGDPLHVRANLRNYGSAVSTARVTLNVDGKAETVSQVALPAAGTAQVLFPAMFDMPGSHVVDVSVDVENDPLTQDNQFVTSVFAQDEMDVLLVDGDPDSQPLRSETDYLAVALSPHSFGRQQLSDLIRTRTVQYPCNLRSDLEQRPQVVVLANVPKLTDAQANALHEYVRQGGAVLMTVGSRTDPVWYNRELGEKRALLPAELGAPRGRTDENSATSRLASQHFDHPALRFFNDPANGDLSTAEIRQWYELITDADSAAILTSLAADDSPVPLSSAAASGVLARLETGEPFLVERVVDEGVFMLMSTACDADWSDLPTKPFYVPLMQQLVTTMATRHSPPLNIRTGEPVVAVFPTPEDEPILSVTTPLGGQRNLSTRRDGHRLTARYDDTRLPGVYSVMSPDGRPLHFVASTSRAESNLELMDTASVEALAENLNATVLSSSTDYLEQDQLRRRGWEIWRFVLAAFLVLLFLELVLQQRFSRVRV